MKDFRAVWKKLPKKSLDRLSEFIREIILKNPRHGVGPGIGFKRCLRIVEFLAWSRFPQSLSSIWKGVRGKADFKGVEEIGMKTTLRRPLKFLERFGFVGRWGTDYYLLFRLKEEDIESMAPSKSLILSWLKMTESIAKLVEELRAIKKRLKKAEKAEEGEKDE